MVLLDGAFAFYFYTLIPKNTKSGLCGAGEGEGCGMQERGRNDGGASPEEVELVGLGKTIDQGGLLFVD
ncbi:hypothetical protein COCNU_scaffold001453G000020 [Cocos nucifera]|nr:hypothetical protein [Cocos nucifera]